MVTCCLALSAAVVCECMTVVCSVLLVVRCCVSFVLCRLQLLDVVCCRVTWCVVAGCLP